MNELQDINTFFHQLGSSAGAIWTENGRIKFSAPKKFQNTATDDFISSNKDQLLSILQENEITSSKKFLNTVIFKDSTQSYYPLSPAQERLWFIEQFEEGTNAYHLPGIFELDAETDKACLKKALQQVVARHEILRSTIELPSNESIAVQIVHDESLSIEEVTFGGDDDYESLIKAEINRPFNLSAEFPIRVKFYTVQSNSTINGITTDKTLLLINTHHIASDGWSLNIFQRELLAYYEANIDKNSSFSLPTLGIQYKDYASWQQSYLNKRILNEQLDYWKNKLSGHESLKLPTDFTRPGKIDYRGQHERFKIDRETSQKLRVLAQEHGATLFSVMLSSIGVLLGKYTGQDDIIIGCPIANRHHRQTQGLIGFFVNTQANRILLKDSQSFEELIKLVHRDQIEAQSYQDLPFEKLVDELGVERDTSRHPVFQVIFSVQNFGYKTSTSANKKNILKNSNIKNAYEVEKFDLSIVIDDGEDELSVEIGFAISQFRQETIKKLTTYYIHLLKQLTETSNQPYRTLSLLNKEDYDKIINRWNATDRAYPMEKTIVQLFQDQVRAVPDKIALAYNNQHLTYKELNEKSSQLAIYLTQEYKERTKKTLQADTLVALCTDRSLEMVVAIFAILKAGGAYVPIDPDYPQGRIDYILNDIDAELILSLRHLHDKVQTKLPADKLIYIDLKEECYKTLDSFNLPLQNDPTSLAYVIYTSGTTGKPKGVMVEHRAFAQFIYNFNDYLSDKLASNDGNLLSLTNYVFDIFGLEYGLPLTTGNKVTLSSVEDVTQQELSEHQIIQQTPSSLFHFSNSYGHLLSDKICLVGGEALSPIVAKSLTTAFLKVINVYGPAETVIWSAAHEVMDAEEISIGTPLMNERIYILDKNRLPVPIGTVGEIYIGGAGLARGYYNQPKLTDERFISNPFITETDKIKGYTRLYKTGDLAKWLPSGNLSFIGRNDSQIKINGFRVELGEIEQSIMKIEGIRQVCVLPKERTLQTGSAKYLVAYYTLENGEDDNAANLEDKLSQTLPAYMIPASWVVMESFPLTVNGKLDKQALPDPEIGTSVHEYVAPESKMELEVCKIWQEVLELDQVGVTDDFFKIGGNSLLALQVTYRMSKLLDCNVKVADLFRLKSIDQLLKLLSKNFELVNPYQSNFNPDLPDLIFIHPGGGGSETYQGLSEMLALKYNCIGVDNYNIHSNDQITFLDKLANHYLSIYEDKYVISEPVNLLGWSLGGTIALEMAAILETRGYKDIHVILLDTLVHDEFMKGFINKRYVEDAMKHAQAKAQKESSLLMQQNAAYVEKVNLAIDAEIEIMRTSISHYLKSTSVTLFKASNVNMFDVLDGSEIKNEYVRMLSSNNVDLVADKVQVINLDCYHNNILQTNSDAIRDHLLTTHYDNIMVKNKQQEIAPRF